MPLSSLTHRSATHPISFPTYLISHSSLCVLLHSSVSCFIRLCLAAFVCVLLHSSVSCFIRLCLASFVCVLLHSSVSCFIRLCLASLRYVLLPSSRVLTRHSHKTQSLVPHACAPLWASLTTPPHFESQATSRGQLLCGEGYMLPRLPLTPYSAQRGS